MNMAKVEQLVPTIIQSDDEGSQIDTRDEEFDIRKLMLEQVGGKRFYNERNSSSKGGHSSKKKYCKSPNEH